jgi:hypothetical protein
MCENQSSSVKIKIDALNRNRTQIVWKFVTSQHILKIYEISVKFCGLLLSESSELNLRSIHEDMQWNVELGYEHTIYSGTQEHHFLSYWI